MYSKTLSICIITKNEELNLTRCINSVKNIADEIIVVDTGSTDNTVNLAKSLGALVYYHKWNNNFSEAKNVALDKCTKDWIFVIDADEALEKNHDLQLKNLIQNTNKEALYLNLINWIGNTSINENQSLRIFRNRKEYRFVSRLHEQIYNSIEKSRGCDVFTTTDLTLNHYGYDHNIVDMGKKSVRNIAVLNSYPDNEKDGLFYFGLGSEYLKINNILEAKEAFIKSISFVDDNKSFRSYASVSLAKACFDLKEYQTALNYVNLFIKELPDFRDLYFLKSVYNHEIGKYSESYIALTIFNALPIYTHKYPTFNFEQTNDIDALLTGLSSLRIPHDNNLLTTVIKVNSQNTAFQDIIKNINEISKTVLVLNHSSNVGINKLTYEIGGTLLDVPSNISSNDLSLQIKSKYSTKYILFLNDDDIVTHNDCITIVNLLNNNDLEKLQYTNYNIVKL